MERSAELALLARCQRKTQQGVTTDRAQASIDTARYTDPARFEREREHLFRKVPAAHVHASELPGPQSFLRRETPLGDLLYSRDEVGVVRVFHNSCRHRGMSLVQEERGTARRFSCPYHGWSYRGDGSLAGVPDEAQCFPHLDKSKLGLNEIPSVEKYGFVWICPLAQSSAEAERVLDNYLGDMGDELAWLELDELRAFDSMQRPWKANWKILTEGGLETYHFSVAHKDTIAPHFLRNTLASDVIGGHFRSTLPTKELQDMEARPETQRRIRDCSHIVYNITGALGLLVQREHVDWFRYRPIAPGMTEITLTSLVPNDTAGAQPLGDQHWRRNLEITDTVLQEDYRIGEAQQRSFDNRAVSEVQFGRNEWTLKVFNDVIEGLCTAHERGDIGDPTQFAPAE